MRFDVAAQVRTRRLWACCVRASKAWPNLHSNLAPVQPNCGAPLKRGRSISLHILNFFQCSLARRLLLHYWERSCIADCARTYSERWSPNVAKYHHGSNAVGSGFSIALSRCKKQCQKKISSGTKVAQLSADKADEWEKRFHEDRRKSRGNGRGAE
jgi:hypothetical protein